MSHAYATVAELVPVAAAALTTMPRARAVDEIRRALLRTNAHIFEACDVAAEAVVQLAEHAHVDPDEPIPFVPADIRLAHDYPGYGG